MKCPFCELPLQKEEDDEYICCNCRIRLTMTDLPNDYVCEDED